MERDWPEGRGIFHNKDKTFLTWVNEEDQLRIISMQEGGDVRAVFDRLARGIQVSHHILSISVFGSPGYASGSTSQIYGSGSFYHQAKLLIHKLKYRNKPKNLEEKEIIFVNVLKITNENSRIRIRIWIH
jgi:protein-arginine kinase